jgi:hypothetical protein
MADPRCYLGDYTPLPGNYGIDSVPTQVPMEPGVAAISATNLQGIYLLPHEIVMYRELMRLQRPIAVLGGTIYLFEVKHQATRDDARTMN